MTSEDKILQLEQRIQRLESVVGLNLKDLRLRAPLALRVKAIQIEVATAHHFSLDALLGDCREKHFVWARWLAIYLSRRITKASSSQLAKLFNRDHGSISHALKAAQKHYELSTEFQADVDHWLAAFSPEESLATPQPESPNGIPH